jgi:DNA transformation protein and related proteins
VSADQLIAHALDLFAPLGPGLTARRMFGGIGFWMRGRFFAIGDPDEGALYLKVDELTRETFLAAGGRPFTYRAKDGAVTVTSYVTPPDAALDDPEAMLPWAVLALEVAGRAAAVKRPKRKPKSAAAGSRPARKQKPVRKPVTRRASKRR